MDELLSEAVRKTSNGPFILLGASVRSLAQSAVSSGWRLICCDFFHDTDLAHLLSVTGNTLLGPLGSFREAPDQLDHISSSIPVVWCGGLENSTEVLERLSEQRPVLGSPIASIRSVRDPARLLSALSAAGLRVPRCHFPSAKTPCSILLNDTDRSAAPPRWLEKPLASAGGQNIHRLKTLTERTQSPDKYVQEEIPGVPMSATFLSDPNRRSTPLWLGACLQFSGLESLNASAFQHCGNLGPLWLPRPVISTLQHAANTIQESFPLRGLFGIDFVLQRGEPVFLEVNPRPTASHTHLDTASPIPLIDLHLQACGVTIHASRHSNEQLVSNPLKPYGSNRSNDPNEDAPQQVSCSLVLYASEQVQLTPEEVRCLMELSGQITDIPQPGVVTPPEAPLLTLQFRAASRGEFCQQVRNRRLPEKLERLVDVKRTAEELEKLLTEFGQHCKS